MNDLWLISHVLNPILLFVLSGWWRRRGRHLMADLSMASSILSWITLLSVVLHG